MSKQIALILLAAGGSTRMGRPKQLLAFAGQSLLRHSAKVAIGTGCSPLIAVLGADCDQTAKEIRDLPILTITNPAWAMGMGTSIQAGMLHVPASAGAVLIMLCDQPRVSTQVLRALIHRHQPRRIAASAYGNTLGVPALFDASFFPALASLPPQAGAKKIIEQYRDCVDSVEFPHGAIDIDTPADYETLLAMPPTEPVVKSRK